LIALSDDNDPFFADRPGRRQEGALWFADLWNRLEVPEGVHLRRLHYLLVSTPGILCPNGEPYRNSHQCWKMLLGASADARYLDLVPADSFVDRRAAEPLVYVPRDETYEAARETEQQSPAVTSDDEPLLLYEPRQWEFPSLPTVALSPPVFAESYAIEIWAEKSTVNDVLVPLAQTRGVTLVTGVGELSITACLALARRVSEHERATRILYISDFDPAGDGMPLSVARKIEFFLRRDDLDHLGVRLDPLVLTAEQVAQYNLPRIPIKDSDRRRSAFEARHGEGATELDALEALHPGELRRIVERAIDVYRLPTRQADREVMLLAAEAREEIAEARRQVIDDYAAALAELRTSFEAAQSEVGRHQQAIADAVAECRRVVAVHAQDWLRLPIVRLHPGSSCPQQPP
jgi:hypothetical protein